MKRLDVGVWLFCVLILYGCSAPSNEIPMGTSSTAEAILDGAQRALGVQKDSGLLQVHTEAAVQGPTGDFRTVIHSSSDGRARMQQMPQGFLGGVGRSGAWLRDPSTGELDELGSRLSFVRGHELHMLALRPKSRLLDAIFLGTLPFESVEALAVEFSLPSGESLVAYFHPLDTIPIGLRVKWTEPSVLISWSDWIEYGGIRLFTKAVFRQADEEFLYHYDRLEVGPVPDALFEPPTDSNAAPPDA